MTNARRHAVDPTVVAVDLFRDGSTVRLRVHDDGRPANPGRGRRASPSYGLAGMRERFSLAGRARSEPGRIPRAAGPSRPRSRPTAEAEGTRASTAPVPVRVLIADDQDMVRVGLATILDAEPSIDVVGQARDGLEAVELVRSLRPDVCLFDIRMPNLDGIEATRRVAGPEVENPVPVIVITTFDQDEYVYDALRAGARGFLLKDADPDLLARAVRSAAHGRCAHRPSRDCATARHLRLVPREQQPKPIDPLTPREEAVLDLVAAGRTNTEIADELYLSLSTVKTHISALMTKLSARNRVEIVIWAYESGRVDDRRHP